MNEDNIENVYTWSHQTKYTKIKFHYKLRTIIFLLPLQDQSVDRLEIYKDIFFAVSQNRSWKQLPDINKTVYVI